MGARRLPPQLCESGWLDKDSPDDWRVQEEVMKFLGI
jgi:hypothetical protein